MSSANDRSAVGVPAYGGCVRRPTGEPVEEVRGSLLDAQDGHDELLGLGEEQLVFGVDVVYVCEVRVVV